MTDEADLELRKEWTRLSRLLYDTHEVVLCTDERDGRAWLSDRYVLIDVTDSVAVPRGLGDEPCDGLYKFTQAKGFQPREGENFLNGGIVDYLNRVEGTAEYWTTVQPTGWSVAEHPGKAMLLTALGKPVLMGESTWTALNKSWKVYSIGYHGGGLNLFRVEAIPFGTTRVRTMAYVAGIQIPDGQQDIARAIAELAFDKESTRK